MDQPSAVFDEAVEEAALEFFGSADADAIASCRGISYAEAVRQLQGAKAKTREEAQQGGPITIDARPGVLMWFVASVDKGTL